MIRSRLSLALLAALLTALPAVASEPPAERGRVVILGFDGADGRTAEGMMDAGELPNLRRLREQGTFARLGTSAPAESPASWACLNSGQNPAKTGVPGFVVNVGTRGSGDPSAGFGHIVHKKGKNAVPIGELLHVPGLEWSALAVVVAAFVLTAAAFFFVFRVLLRIRAVPALSFALLLGIVGGYGGHVVRGYLPARVPRIENPNRARNLWDWAAEGGARSIVLDAVEAFDMPVPEGARVLAGLGIPDARASLGEWFIYTTDPAETDLAPAGRDTGTAGTEFRVDERDGRILSAIYGPVNFWEEERLRSELAEAQAAQAKASGFQESQELGERVRELETRLTAPDEIRTQVELEIELRADEAAVTIDGATQVLKPGEWSDWYSLTFNLNPILAVHAVTRCRLVSLREPHFELYVDKLDIDPRDPPFWQPISQPPGFAAELAEDFGPFETYGWQVMTMPFKDEEIPVELLLEDIQFTFENRERLAYQALQRDDWELFMSVEGTTDRAQHMLYQYFDPEHPLYDAEQATREVEFFGRRLPLSEAIPEMYRQVDRMVGTVMDRYLGADDTLLVCSDHGFQSFRYQFLVNNWLAQNGFLTLDPDVKKAKPKLAEYVDWSRTQAYSMGLGFIYLNLEGRERKGIVPPEEADLVLARIREALLATVDPVRGTPVVTDSYLTKEIHAGPFLDKEADLLIGCAPLYRVSWNTTTGGILLEQKDGAWVPAPFVQDNDSPWSADHVSVDLDEVRGVFFSNRRFALPEGGPNLLHIAPTTLALLGVPIPPEMDRAPLVAAE